MILCVSPNTNIERTWSIPNLHLGGVFHTQDEVTLASGKAINTARAIQALGGQALATGFAAGHSGQLFAKLAEQEGLRGEWVWVEGESRLALALVDPLAAGSDATLISGRGPQVSTADWQRLSETTLRLAEQASLVCFAGSFPPRSDLEVFADLVRSLQAMPRPVWIDLSKAALQAGVAARPAGVKVNAVEAGELTGIPIHDREGALLAAAALRRMGAGWAAVTLGKRGAVLDSGETAWLVSPAQTSELRSSVGSGDAFLGGLLLGLEGGKAPAEALRMAAAAGAANALDLGGCRFHYGDYLRALETVAVSSIQR